MPIWGIRSFTARPSSACFKTATICSVENRCFFIDVPPQKGKSAGMTNITSGPLSPCHLSNSNGELDGTSTFYTGADYREAARGGVIGGARRDGGGRLPTDWARRTEGRKRGGGG